MSELRVLLPQSKVKAQGEPLPEAGD
jgi:hypothetical protein